MMVLCLNPPRDTSGNRTASNVGRLAAALDVHETRLLNLCSCPSRSFVDFVSVGARPGSWLDSRIDLERNLADFDSRSDLVVAAWGRSRFSGPTRTHLAAQIDWVMALLESLGCSEVLTFGDSARHPSRWHQYVSDKHDRFPQVAHVSRYAAAIVRTTPTDLVADARARPTSIAGETK
jgi:hypothetical protein